MKKAGGLDCSRISPTAVFVAMAKGKILGSSEYAQKIAEEIVNEVMRFMSPLLELRYRSLTEIVKKHVKSNRIGGIVEIAAGLSSRGLEITEKYKHIDYIEVDLSEIMKQKRRIVEKILWKKGGAAKRYNLFFFDGDILDIDSLSEAAMPINGEPVLVITEGLMPYLYKKEKKIAAKNIYDLISAYGGVWITNDFSSRSNRESIGRLVNHDKRLKNIFQWIIKVTGRDIQKNAFNSDYEVDSFLQGAGFAVKTIKQTDIIGIKKLRTFSLLEEKDKGFIKSLLEKSEIKIMSILKTQK